MLLLLPVLQMVMLLVLQRHVQEGSWRWMLLQYPRCVAMSWQQHVKQQHEGRSQRPSGGREGEGREGVKEG